MSTNTGAVFWNDWSTSDGGLIQTTIGQSSGDATKWTFIAVGLDTFDPGMTYRLAPQHAPPWRLTSPTARTTNGTGVQQLDTGRHRQKFFVADAARAT